MNKTLAEIIADCCHIIAEALPEDIRIEDSFDNAETIEQVRNLAKYSEWGWCCAKVTVTYKGITETEYLGGCSYDNEHEFQRCSYFADMVAECCKRIANQVDSIVRAHSKDVLR